MAREVVFGELDKLLRRMCCGAGEYLRVDGAAELLDADVVEARLGWDYE